MHWRGLAGEILALLGENGAGKSTLIKLLVGIYRIDRGEIFFDGAAQNEWRSSDRRQQPVTFIQRRVFSLTRAAICPPCTPQVQRLGNGTGLEAQVGPAGRSRAGQTSAWSTGSRASFLERLAVTQT